MPEQDLHGTQISGRLVDDRCLRPTERVRAVVLTPQSDTCDPLVDQARILPGTDVLRTIDAAGKGVVVYRATRLSSQASKLERASSFNSN
jgi:nitrate reductase NapAB chaperone NapD